MAVINGASRLSEKLDVGLEKLEPKYIESCNNVKELEKILRILRSGEEGTYLHLEKQCELKLTELAPQSRLLRKETRLVSTNECEDKNAILDELKTWTEEIKDKGTSTARKGAEEQRLPPVRSNIELTGSTKVKGESSASKKRNPAPRDHREWDRIIHNLEEESDEPPPASAEPSSNFQASKVSQSLASHINTTGMTDEERVTVANREKDKGNEAFRSGDLMEAIAYYNRSLSVLPVTATYNNRALAYIRANKWSDAVADCNRVLAAESGNIKALLRRACAYKSLRKFRPAKDDLEVVLQTEPCNKRAKDMLREVSKNLEEQDNRKAQGMGNRMVIEETDGESEEEAGEVEVPATASAPASTSPTLSSAASGAEAKEVSSARRIPIVEESDSESSDESSNPRDVNHIAQGAGDSLRGASDSPRGANDSPRGDSDSPMGATDSPRGDSDSPRGASDSLRGAGDSPRGATDSPRGASDSPRGAGDSPTDVSNNLRDEVTNSSASNEEQLSAVGMAADSNTSADTPALVANSDESEETNALKMEPLQDAAAAKAGTTESANETPKTEPSLEDFSTEPKVVVVPVLPESAAQLKNTGNDLFKAGRYGEASGYYSQALNLIEKDSRMFYHQAVLHSNRAACQIKTGDCRAAVNDCTTALDLVPSNAKALLRRATAQEMLERYKDAYVDYRHVINIDSNATTAYAGANRCEQMLSRAEGSKWRSTLPKVPSSSYLPVYEVQKAPTSLPADVLSSQSTSSTNDPQTSEKLVVESNEEKFQRLKESGNQHSKTDYEKAINFYTQAIAIFPDRVAPYSNRALCHFKSNNHRLAVEDCDTVLAMEPTHIKALFRRAQAQKELCRYKESLSDLMNLLKVDPTNKPASKELAVVKLAYKKHLDSLQQSASTKKPVSSHQNVGAKESKTLQSKTTKAPKTAMPNETKTSQSKTTKESKMPQPKASSGQATASKGKGESVSAKKSTRILIEEASDSDVDSSQQVGASSSASTASAQKHGKSKSRQKKKQATKKAASEVKTSQPTVPTLSASPTAYEFTQAWTSMRRTTDLAAFAQLLRQIPPSSLVSVISNKLEPDMLENLIICMDNHFTTDELETVEQYLKSLSLVPRLSMISMFMSASCKKALQNLFRKVEVISSQVDKLRIAFGF